MRRAELQPKHTLALLPTAAFMVFVLARGLRRLATPLVRWTVPALAMALVALDVSRGLTACDLRAGDLQVGLDRVASRIAAGTSPSERLLIGTHNHFAESYLYFATPNPTANRFYLSYQITRLGMLPEVFHCLNRIIVRHHVFEFVLRGA